MTEDGPALLSDLGREKSRSTVHTLCASRTKCTSLVFKTVLRQCLKRAS
jgi:hypothetical protein